MAVLESELLRIYVGADDRYDSSAMGGYQGRPLYEVVTEEARRRGLAGASVFKGVLGFGAGSRIHQQGFLREDKDLPVVIEIIDTPEKIAGFLPVVLSLVGKSLITREMIHVVTQGP